MSFFKILAKKMPGLKDKLILAQMDETSEHFLKKIFTVSIMATFSINILVFAPILKSFDKPLLPVLIALPILFLFFFNYLLKIPDLQIMKLQKKISKEILFALRFLIIEIQSGVTIYKAFENIRNHYPTIGIYFGKVLDKINYGKDIDESLNWAIKVCPSDSLRKIFFQILNSLKTGADMGSALDATVEQITREQQIMINQYAKKLNPIAMFYMIVAVIFPSIGFMMIIIISSFVGLNISLPILLGIVALVGFIQYIFVSTVKSIRPPIEM